MCKAMHSDIDCSLRVNSSTECITLNSGVFQCKHNTHISHTFYFSKTQHKNKVYPNFHDFSLLRVSSVSQ